MLDNLGFGEIAMLALLALLFFGPERLPQMGARIGRWIATLTQSSKAFMNEWREEALVVYDAVEEVKGIRDEIVAARAEIAGTVSTAREDVNDALSGAKDDVQAQVRGATTFSPTPDVTDSSARSSQIPIRGQRGEDLSANPDRAIERTNEILAGLREKRGETEPPASPPEPAPSTTFSDASPQNQSAQHLWHRTAPGARKSSRTEPQPAAAPAPTPRADQRTRPPSPLASLRETVIALESDVQALRDELARTRAALEAKALSPGSEARPRAEPEPIVAETDTTPHPQPAQSGEQAGEPR